MNNQDPKFGEFLIGMFRLIWAPLIIFMLLLALVGCQKYKQKEVSVEYLVVDSVWILPPGKISTIQVSPVYCYKRNNQVIRSVSKVEVGDTIVYKTIKLTK